MDARTTIKGTIMAIVAVALLTAFIPGAYAQGPGGPLPGVFPGGGNGFFPGLPGPNLNDPRTANLVGAFLGSFLGTIVTNNQYRDRDDYNYYYYGNRDRYRDREDYRYYNGYNRGYNERPFRGYHRGDNYR
jgi:hypothetical protein